MKILKAAPALFCVVAMSSVFSSVASAQYEQGDYNRKTTVTFSAPVEIPGVHLKGFRVLPAGTYVFKLVDSQVNRHIVQIQSADEKKTYATILAIPNTRVKRTNDTVITFRERPSGEPPALRAWFYPDAAWGEEFVYGKTKAKELAQSNNTPVLYSPDETQQAEVSEPIQPVAAPVVAQMDAAPVMAYNPAGDEVELSQAVTAPEPAPAPVQMAAATPAPMPVPSPSPAPATLPQTGSELWLTMLTGLLSLAAAFGVRSIRQHSL